MSKVTVPRPQAESATSQSAESRNAGHVSHVGIEDVQGRADHRNIAIDRVGIKSLRYPMAFSDRSGVQHTVAVFNMSVALSPKYKGTHMSRFVDILSSHSSAFSVDTFRNMLLTVRDRLESERAVVEMEFPWFVTKAAPVSGVKSMIDYQVTLIGEIHGDETSTRIRVVVPVTSLCPCSKKISEYGAHNQRSHVTVEVSVEDNVQLEELIEVVESQASSELYGMLKRVDEKYVTEKAYDNPKFVEDMVRDVADSLSQDERILGFRVCVENFESIHNHSAYAEVVKERQDRDQGS